MGLIVSDAEAEKNGDFNEALKSDYDGSKPPPLIDPSSMESIPIRNAVVDVLNGLNDPVPFMFGSSLLAMNTNDERINHLEPNLIVICRLSQSINIPINRPIQWPYGL